MAALAYVSHTIQVRTISAVFVQVEMIASSDVYL